MAIERQGQRSRRDYNDWDSTGDRGYVKSRRDDDRNLPAKVDEGKVEELKAEFEAKARDYAAMLPPTVKVEAFVAALTTAVRKEPKLLAVDRLSLMIEVEKCANDGLIPDGREAVILYQKDNRKGCLVARYTPMIKGVRKVAWLYDSIVMRAEVVYSGDKFRYCKGDHPRIEHEESLTGDRGKRVAAYAIFTQFKDGHEYILHREVMNAAEIQKVRDISKQPNGDLWKIWTDEAWKKSVVHRAKKTVPVSERLEAVINRWEDNFDFNGKVEDARSKVAALPPRGERPALPPRSSDEPAPRFDRNADDAELEPVEDRRGRREEPKKSAAANPAGNNGRALTALSKALERAENLDDMDEAWRNRLEDIHDRGDQFKEAAEKLYEDNKARIRRSGRRAAA